MSNWCWNRVEFFATAALQETLENLFNKLAEKEAATQQGQFPEFIQADFGWMHEIRYDEQALYYQTKWSPNTEIMLAIAKYFNCGFHHEFEETGCLIYGETVYKDGVLTERWLSPADFDLYEMNEECDQYFFEGNRYESDAEILEILLNRKPFERTA